MSHVVMSQSTWLAPRTLPCAVHCLLALDGQPEASQPQPFSAYTACLVLTCTVWPCLFVLDLMGACVLLHVQVVCVQMCLCVLLGGWVYVRVCECV